MGFGLMSLMVFFVFGLMIGSFLNVVIHRLPRMMEIAWERECREMREEPSSKTDSPLPFNLLVPRSRCPKCEHSIAWYENVPVMSYMFLRGRCSNCAARISPRYPLVEIVTGLLFTWCGYRYGVTTSSAIAWCGFASAMIVLTLIDWDTTLLPDDITLPLLWAGLISAQLGISGVSPSSALWGAVGGYLSLWSIYWIFKLVTGKEGMGYGDFKLLAALGAWFGWEALLAIILMSSVIGALVGVALKLNSQLRDGRYIPFGPFLAGAGLTTMFFGTENIRRTLGI